MLSRSLRPDVFYRDHRDDRRICSFVLFRSFTSSRLKHERGSVQDDVILLTVENCCWLRGPKNEEKQESPDQGNHDRCEEQEIQNRGEKGGENGDS